MYVIILLANLLVASAVPKRSDNNQENNDYSPPESQSEETLSQLRTLFRKDLHQAALYSEEEIKEYLGDLRDSTPHVSDSMLKTQHGHGHEDLAWKDSPGAGDFKEHDGAAADADDVSAPEVHTQGLKSPALDEKQDRDSGVWDTRDPFLADQGDNSEDPTDEHMSRSADGNNKNKITISIDAVRIRNENERNNKFGQVNDQRDNAVAYPRHWANSEQNSYFRGRTRSSSSPSAEALAMLTQKLSKLEVEVGRLKEVVLLQGAVHIKTSERIEMMLLTQGKLAVKNDLDTRKVLKRVKRCCSCSVGGKTRRALRRARKGPTHVKPNKEKPTPKTLDASPALSISYPDRNGNMEERNRQNNGNSDQSQVVERRQSDSHSQEDRNSPKLQRDHRDDERLRENEKHGAESDQSSKTVSILPQHNHAMDSSTSVYRRFSPQVTNSSKTALGNQPDGNTTGNGPTIRPDDGNQRVQAAQQHGDQEDRFRQVTTPSGILSTTKAPKSVDNITIPKATHLYEDKTIPSAISSTFSTNTPSILSTLAKQFSTVRSTVTHRNVHTARNIPTWSQPAETTTALKKSTVTSENDSLSPELNESKNQYTKNPVPGNPTSQPILDVTRLLDDKVVTGSNERQTKVTKEHQRRESDNILDPVPTTTQHMALTTPTSTIMSTAVIDGSSEDEHADKLNVNGAKYPTPDSTLDSGSFHTSPFPPRTNRNDINTPYSAVSSFANTTSSSELPHETEITYSPANQNNDNANIRQHSISNKANLNKNDSYNNQHDGDQLSTNGYRVNPTLLEENANLNAESQTRDQSSTPVLPVSTQQPTKSSLYSNQKNGEISTKVEQRIPDTSIYDLLEHSTTTYDTTTTTHPTQTSSSTTSSPPSKPTPEASSNYENEEMTNSAEHSTLSTVSKDPAGHKDVEVSYQSSSSVPVTTTFSRRSTILSTILLTTTTTTSTSTSAKLPPSSTSASPSIQTSERQSTKVFSSPPSSITSAKFPDTTISATQTRTSATTSSSSTTTTTMPTTRRKSTQTTSAVITETTPTTTTPTTTEEGEPELAVDLSTGLIRNDNLPGVTWVVYPSSRPSIRKRSVLAASDSGAGAASRHCSIQGVLKFSFTPPSSRRRHRPSRGRSRRQGHRPGDGGGGDGDEGEEAGSERRRLLLEMEFRRPHRWVFNVGDSSANNGFSGDGSVQENDCEAQGYGQSFAVYASDKHTNGRQKLLKSFNNFIHDKLTLVISDQSITWDNHRGHADNLTDASLFALSGQYDRQGPVNYDVYLGLNRVIAGQYRRGHGLCRVTARWLKG